MGFGFINGELYCDRYSVKTVFQQVGHTPFFLYSGQEIQDNYDAYANALSDIPAVISYAVKANGNLHILERMQGYGSWATLVSGGEIRLALAAGFDPQRMIYNGNGKTIAELTLAVESGIMVNIDSEFDLDHIQRVTESVGKRADVLLRINPDIDPNVHPYISTGLKNSKFGLNLVQIPEILARLKGITTLNLAGLHCHLGSTITDIKVFSQTMEVMAAQFVASRELGFAVKYLNLGGGLGIDYRRTGDAFPTPDDLVNVIRDQIPKGAILILEPGRSLIGSAGALICSVIGVKSNGLKKFIVTDGSMAELLRPSLYDAYHCIEFIGPVRGELGTFEVVGPICESSDFLGKDRVLPSPPEGTGVVIFDAGAYGYAMSSNYNARLRPAEYLLEDDQLILIRRAECFDDYMGLY
jgi:diaminopimelate decarboxylase